MNLPSVKDIKSLLLVLERVPLAILFFTSILLIISMFKGGFYIELAAVLFLYGILSAFIRQIYKDIPKVFKPYLVKSYKLQVSVWIAYTIFQLILLGVVVYVVFSNQEKFFDKYHVASEVRKSDFKTLNPRFFYK